MAEVDLAYPELRIAIEIDGKVHLQPEVRERDLPRQNDLVLLGWTVLRFTWTRYTTRPASVVAEVRAGSRRRAGGDPPLTTPAKARACVEQDAWRLGTTHARSSGPSLCRAKTPGV